MIVSQIGYFSILLYGNEAKQPVHSPEVFRGLVTTLHGVFKDSSLPARCRGRITGHLGKNCAPRAGAFSTDVLDGWVEKLQQLGDQKFARFELFGPVWKPGQHPLIYAAIDRLHDIFPCVSQDGTEAGASNCVTLAVHNSLFTDSWRRMETTAKQLVSFNAAFYGYLNPSDAWDFEVGGGFRTRMMDIRFRDTLAYMYQHHQRRLTDYIPDLYEGNLLSISHFAPGGMQAMREAGALVAEWPNQLTYVRLPADPQADKAFRARVLNWFNVVTEGA